jgi:thymidylate synthase
MSKLKRQQKECQKKLEEEYLNELKKFKESLKEENIEKTISKIIEENKRIRESNKTSYIKDCPIYSYVFKDYINDTYDLENFTEEELKQIDKIVEALKKDENNLSEDEY